MAVRRSGSGTLRLVLWSLLGLGIVATAQALANGPLWRRAYPYLPTRVQALPYQLKGLLPAAERSPVPLPTASVGEASGEAIPAGRQGAAAAVSGPTATSRVVMPTTVAPSGAATPPSISPVPAATLPSAQRMEGVAHVYQTWNNCGPATVSMALSALGVSRDQREVARFLKPDPEDKNVSPDEMTAYIATLPDLAAIDRQAGDLDLLRRLLGAGFPVIVETWFEPDPGDEMGHYRLLLGYEDGTETGEGQFLAHDSYLGPDRPLAYASFDADWRRFNRRFVVPHRRVDSSRLLAILGPLGDAREAASVALARARAESAATPDAAAWLNLGSSLLLVGDASAAAAAFDQALALGLHWRTLWYQFGPFEAYAAVGRWEDLRTLAAANLANAANLEESLYWMARAEAAAGESDLARRHLEKALDHRPGYAAAAAALAELSKP